MLYRTSLIALLTFASILVIADQATAMYHTQLGRFATRDPLGYPDGLNTYAGYHIMWGGVDPYGEDSVDLYNREHNLLSGGKLRESRLGPTFVWGVSVPDEKCNPPYTNAEAYEYEFVWNITNTNNGNKVSGGYHVSVIHDNPKETWRINLGRGTGYYRHYMDFSRDWIREHHPNFKDYSRERKDEIRHVANEYGKKRSAEEASARWVGGAQGTATYSIIKYCICYIGHESFKDWHPPEGNLPRADSENTTESTNAARFLSLGDNDPRGKGYWRMGSLPTTGDDIVIKKAGSTSGGLRFDFDKKHPNIREVRTQ